MTQTPSPQERVRLIKLIFGDTPVCYAFYACGDVTCTEGEERRRTIEATQISTPDDLELHSPYRGGIIISPDIPRTHKDFNALRVRFPRNLPPVLTIGGLESEIFSASSGPSHDHYSVDFLGRRILAPAEKFRYAQGLGFTFENSRRQ
jgi:hypothetical protein